MFFIYHTKGSISLWPKSGNLCGEGENVLASESQMHYTLTHTVPLASNLAIDLCALVLRPGCRSVGHTLQSLSSCLFIVFLLPESGRHQWESCLQQEQLNKKLQKLVRHLVCYLLKNLLRLVLTKWGYSFSRHWIAKKPKWAYSAEDKNSLPLPKHEKEVNSATGPVSNKHDGLRLEEAQGLTEMPSSPGLC